MMKALLLLVLLPVAALAQPLPPGAGGAGSPGLHHLYANGTSVGNGADTTQDTLMTTTLVAGQLAAVGDVISIQSGGTLAATTDSRLVRLTFGGTVIASCTGTIAGSTAWYLDARVVKTGSNTQSYISNCTVASTANNVPRSGTLTLTDTGTIVVLVNGQNSTNPVAGSITAQAMMVDYLH